MNACSCGSRREMRSSENSRRNPSWPTETSPFAMSCASSAGSWRTDARCFSRVSRKSAAAASRAASPLSSSTHTALAPSERRSVICFRAGESRSCVALFAVSGADHTVLLTRLLAGNFTTSHGSGVTLAARESASKSGGGASSRSTLRREMFACSSPASPSGPRSRAAACCASVSGPR